MARIQSRMTPAAQSYDYPSPHSASRRGLRDLLVYCISDASHHACRHFLVPEAGEDTSFSRGYNRTKSCLRQNRCRHQRLRRAKLEPHRMKPESFPLKNPLISNKKEREYNDKKLKTKRMQRLGDAATVYVAGMTAMTASQQEAVTSDAWSSAAKWP